MSPLLLRPKPHQIPRRLRKRLGNRRKLFRVPGVAHGLRDLELGLVMEEGGFGAEELAVGEDGAGEGFGEPVEGYGVEDLVDGRGGVGPLDEFLADLTCGYGVSGCFILMTRTLYWEALRRPWGAISIEHGRVLCVFAAERDDFTTCTSKARDQGFNPSVTYPEARQRLRKSEEGERWVGAHQASCAIGLDERTKPTVAGLVPCSRA